MNRSQRNRIRHAALAAGLVLALTSCSSRQPDGVSLVDAVSQAVGFGLPADSTILGYHHRHGDDASGCSQLWIIRASSALAGPDRRTSQKRARSPFDSLKLLVEQGTDGQVMIDAADPAACECVEWQRGETMCRLRQAQTRDGWVAALEAVSSH